MERQEELQEENLRKIKAVGAIIMSDDGKILIVQGTVNKPQKDKMAGDWTFPAETLKPGEDWTGALTRLVSEEVGGIKYRVDYARDWIGDYNVGSVENPIWGRVLLLHVIGRAEEQPCLSSIDGEVVGHKWVLPRSLQSLPRRKGVWEPLKDFLAGQRGIVCWKCVPGER